MLDSARPPELLRPEVAVARRAGRRSAGGEVLCAGVACCLSLALLLLPGCKDDRAEEDLYGTSVQGSGLYPALDVRGGDCDAQISTGVRTIFEGNGGTGGTISVTSTGGRVSVNVGAAPAPPALSFPAPADPTAVIDVLPGQSQTVSGYRALDWLRVQAGGTLRVAGDSVLSVTGDVEISGKVESAVSEDSIRGKNLTLVAGGSILIQGTLSANGFTKDERRAARPDLYAGGDGGAIRLQCNAGGIHIAQGGAVVADGGRTYSPDGFFAVAGSGGSIRLETTATVVVAGRISARGGEAYTTATGYEGEGGEISIEAQGDVEFYNAAEWNATGGSASGSFAGAGGSVTVQASTAIDLEALDIQALGGGATYLLNAEAGPGGQVTLEGPTVRLSDVRVDVSGGSGKLRGSSAGAVARLGGLGAQGGSIEITGATLYLGDGSGGELPIELRSGGGRTTTFGSTGASGGEIRLVGGGTFLFEGAAAVPGGPSEDGIEGLPGTVCATGASDAVRLKIGGTSGTIPEDCS